MAVSRQIRRAVAVAVAAAALAALTTVPATGTSATVKPLPVNAKWDYQIGQAYRPPAGVRVVSRDREARPPKSGYAICYVNAFQAQPQEAKWWKAKHRNLLLRRADGRFVVDSAWGEILFDVGTPSKRRALARIVGRWISGCNRDGFDAVEPDNLDSWTRSKGLLSRGQAFAFAALLVKRSHAEGLAIAQKNAAGSVQRGVDVGFDFAVAEECGRWHECGAYARAYDDRVLVVEYRDVDFARTCTHWGDRLSVIRRDRMVRAPGAASYRYDSC